MRYTTVSVPVDLVDEWKEKHSLSVSDFVKLSLVTSLVDDKYLHFLKSYSAGLLKDSDYNKYLGGL